MTTSTHTRLRKNLKTWAESEAPRLRGAEWLDAHDCLDPDHVGRFTQHQAAALVEQLHIVAFETLDDTMASFVELAATDEIAGVGFNAENFDLAIRLGLWAWGPGATDFCQEVARVRREAGQ